MSEMAGEQLLWDAAIPDQNAKFIYLRPICAFKVSLSPHYPLLTMRPPRTAYHSCFQRQMMAVSLRVCPRRNLRGGSVRTTQGQRRASPPK